MGSMENLLTEQLIINIPSSTTCRYIVTTDNHIDHPEQLIVDLLATNSTIQQSADLLPQAINTSHLRIRSYAAEDSPCQAELAYIAAPMHEDEHPLSASRHIVIDCQTSPTQQPQHARLIRSIVRALADATNGQLADPCTAQLVRPIPGINGERDWFCPADDWVGVDCRINPDGGMDTPARTNANACACSPEVCRDSVYLNWSSTE
jgi:hypothetical protein